VHPLVDKLAASRDGTTGAPFGLVAEATAVTVPGAHVEDRAERLRSGEGDRPRRGRVEPVVEADLHPPTPRLRRLRDPLDVLDTDPCGLLDQDVRRGFQGSARMLGKPVVGHGDDHDVEVVPQELVERPARDPAEPVDERVGRAGVDVEAGDEGVLSERRGPLVADEPTADYADAKRGPLRLRRRHVYSTP
jgi:hypothetical protein